MNKSQLKADLIGFRKSFKSARAEQVKKEATKVVHAYEDLNKRIKEATRKVEAKTVKFATAKIVPPVKATPSASIEAVTDKNKKLTISGDKLVKNAAVTGVPDGSYLLKQVAGKASNVTIAVIGGKIAAIAERNTDAVEKPGFKKIVRYKGLRAY